MSSASPQQWRQLASVLIFGAMIVGAVAQINSGHAKSEWDAMNRDERYYLPFFKSKRNA